MIDVFVISIASNGMASRVSCEALLVKTTQGMLNPSYIGGPESANRILGDTIASTINTYIK